MKIRADVKLVNDQMAPSREKAQALIMAGKVYSGERKINKASEMISSEEALTVRGDDGFASRGSYKLEKALDVFSVDVNGMVAMDIGAAAGGFTDVLLRRHAGHVYAIDVGYGQLDWKIRNDPRVTVMERTNARFMQADWFELHPVLTVMDVSFISIRLILPAAAQIMGESGRFVTLIKPQFEAGKNAVSKNGVVRDERVHQTVIREIRDFSVQMGWCFRQLTYSPIKGPAGNIEFLADIMVSGKDPIISDDEISRIVKEAHQQL